MIPSHPMRLGPAILHHLKQGKPVEKITVWFTHGQLHQLFSEKISGRFPLEIILSQGQDMEKKIDCRLFEAPWHIDVRTDEQKQADKRAKAAIAPAEKPPELTQQEQELADAVFASYYALAATEYRLLQRQVERELIRQLIRQRKVQEQSEGTAHE